MLYEVITLEQYYEALQAFTQATNVDPQFAAAWFHMGLIYTDLVRHRNNFV